MAKSTISKAFFRIVEFLNQVTANFIKFPNRNQKAETKKYFEAHSRLIGIVGAVNGTYVPCKVPSAQWHIEIENFNNHKNVQQNVANYFDAGEKFLGDTG